MRRIISMGLIGYAAVAMPIDLPPPAASKTALIRSFVDAKVKGDSVQGHRLLRLKEADRNASYLHSYKPIADPDAWLLPNPEVTPQKPKHISLRDAIVLALRNNPGVKTAKLQRILDKFTLELAKQLTGVQWNALTASAKIINRANPTWTAGTGITVKAPTGTNFSVAQSNNLLGGAGTTTVSMTQHLLKGFGLAVNQINYANAVDAEKTAKLAFKNSIINTVVTVITNYRALVSEINTLETTKQNLVSQEENVRQDKLRVKAGQMAPSELILDQASLEGARLSVVQDQQTLLSDEQTFLLSLGLIPTTKMIVDKKISIDNIHVPSVEKCTKIALKNNIAYQTALINLNATKRALITAKDARKWTLDMTSSVTEGAQRSGVGLPITDQATNPSLTFSLSVPIDNISGKQGVVSAQIGIENAESNLEQTKESLISSVVTQWQAIQNLYQQILSAQAQLKYQIQSLENDRLRLQYGKISMLDFTTVQSQLLTQQTNFIGIEINYLNAVTTLYQTLGMTLDQWDIKLRY